MPDCLVLGLVLGLELSLVACRPQRHESHVCQQIPVQCQNNMCMKSHVIPDTKEKSESSKVEQLGKLRCDRRNSSEHWSADVNIWDSVTVFEWQQEINVGDLSIVKILWLIVICDHLHHRQTRIFCDGVLVASLQAHKIKSSESFTFQVRRTILFLGYYIFRCTLCGFCW